MNDNVFADDFLQQPQWWDEVPREEPKYQDPSSEVDVLIVGSGFTGLNAAIVSARAGAKTVVLDRGPLGRGASTRLVGYIGRFLHYSIGKLISLFGEEQAIKMYREGGDAHFHFLDFVKEEQFDVGLLYRGRFSAACTPAAYEASRENAEHISKYISFKYEMCPKERQRDHLGTDAFHGGMILHEHGTVQPAMYHSSLIGAAIEAGAQVVGGCAVTKIDGGRGAFEVHTERGVIRAREVITCTNGYSNEEWGAVPFLRKRVIPVVSYQIATEPLEPELMKAVKPTGMAVYDSRENLNWDRPTHDDRILIYGGRTGTLQGDPLSKATKLHKSMVKLYPDLEGVKIRRYWSGNMGFSFDRLLHVGCNDRGIHYAAGFSASGLPLGTYFGKIVARRALGLEGGETAFWNLKFPTQPYFNGNPWFVPIASAMFDFQDWRGGRGNMKSG